MVGHLDVMKRVTIGGDMIGEAIGEDGFFDMAIFQNITSVEVKSDGNRLMGDGIIGDGVLIAGKFTVVRRLPRISITHF